VTEDFVDILLKYGAENVQV